jgi:hypothetical protein
MCPHSRQKQTHRMYVLIINPKTCRLRVRRSCLGIVLSGLTDISGIVSNSTLNRHYHE